MKKRLRTTWVLSPTLLLLLLCCLVSAEEQKSNLESKEILSETVETTTEENESKSQIANHHEHDLNQLSIHEHNDVHDHHNEDDRHGNVDGYDHHDEDGHDHDDSVDDGGYLHHHEKVEEVAVERDDLITVKKDVHDWKDPLKIPPPWDPLSSIGKPPPTRPPYR